MNASMHVCSSYMGGGLQLEFRVLADWPLRDAHRLPWLAPCRPAIKATLVEHRLSNLKHTWYRQSMNELSTAVIGKAISSWILTLSQTRRGTASVSQGAQKHLGGGIGWGKQYAVFGSNDHYYILLCHYYILQHITLPLLHTLHYYYLTYPHITLTLLPITTKLVQTHYYITTQY